MKLLLCLFLVFSMFIASCDFPSPVISPPKSVPGETMPLPEIILKEIRGVVIVKPIILSAKETSPGTWVIKIKNIKSGKVRLVIGYQEYDAQITSNTVTINTGWQPPYQENGYRVTAGVIQNGHYIVSVCVAGGK